MFIRASNTFCQMACGMLTSIGDFLRMGSDEIVKNMYDVSDDIDEEDSSTRCEIKKKKSFLNVKIVKISMKLVSGRRCLRLCGVTNLCLVRRGSGR